MVNSESNAKAKAAPAKAKASVRKPAIRKTTVPSKATSSNGSRTAVNNKKSSKDSKKVIAQSKHRRPPIPNGWPVTSKSSYPPPTFVSQRDQEDEEMNPQDSLDLSQKVINYLKPGNLLKVNCNGSDVFLRKRAVQSTSLSFPSGDGYDNKASKGGPTRFLVVFPGRISLKPPKEVSKASLRSEDCDNIVDEPKEEEDEGEGDEPCALENEKEEFGDDVNKHAQVKKTRSPFAPTNPPHLLGKLVSLGGADRRMELRIPFSLSSQSNKTSTLDSTTSNDDQGKQLVFSGRAIPLEGKFMALTFKRTGGSGGGKDSSKSAKHKKIGTGSIACKDIFRSVIVLGESKLRNGKDGIESGSGTKEEARDNTDEADKVVLRHYGGSDRTVDGGGHGGVGASKKMIAGRKDSLGTAKSTFPAKGIDEDESDVDSDKSDDVVNDEDENNASDLDSDGEFVPDSSKKRKKSSKDEKEDEPLVPEPKRKSRRSASKAVNVSYVDEDSDVDLETDDSEPENESDNDSHSDSDAFDELLDSISKKGRVEPKPKVKTITQHNSNEKSSKTTTPRTNAKRGRKSSSKSAASAKKISYVEIDSDNDDPLDGKVVVLDSDISVEGKEGVQKGNGATASSTNEKSKMTAKPISKKKVTKSKMTPLSSPLKSPISPRRRKKASPHKTPSPNRKNDVLDLSDDSFSFL